MENLNGLRAGMEVYCLFKKGILKQIRGKSFDVICDDSSYITADIKEIFLPSQYVKFTSQMVAQRIKKIEAAKCSGATINQKIYNLFEAHWIKMCENEKYESIQKTAYLEYQLFVRELEKVIEIVNGMSVSGIPFLAR